MITQNLPQPAKVNPQWRVAIVYGLYNQQYTEAMANGAKQELIVQGIPEANITLYPVLGSFEVPLIGAALAEKKATDALIGIGAIIKGDTFHDEHLARETTRGCMEVQLKYRIPFAYEILHVKSEKDLADRAQGEGNKGKEAALAVLHALAQLALMQ